MVDNAESAAEEFGYVEGQVALGDASVMLSVAAGHADDQGFYETAEKTRAARDGLKQVMALLDRADLSSRTETP